MKTYRMMVILRTDATDAGDDKKVKSIVEKMLADTDGKITDIDMMGKRSLSYPIVKQKEGIYLDVTVGSASLKVGDIQKTAKLMPEVLRFLVTLKE